MEANNMKAMCEALEMFLADVGDYSADGLLNQWTNIRGETIRKARAALAAPPRNCDREECQDFGDSCNIFDREVPDSRRLWGEDYWCEHGKWLLATATEQKGEPDAIK